MLHLEFLTRLFYSTEWPCTNTVTQLAGKENAKFTFTTCTTNQDLRVSIQSKPSQLGLSDQCMPGQELAAGGYMYERMQGGIFTLVVSGHRSLHFHGTWG